MTTRLHMRSHVLVALLRIRRWMLARISRASARRWLLALAVGVVAGGLTACGGGSGMPANAVAGVGGETITKATLGHWTSALFGNYYYEKTVTPAPEGVITDPPSYARCAAALEAVTSHGGGGHPVSQAGQFESRCQRLDEAMTREAMSYLIIAALRDGEAAEAGVKVTAGEFKQYFARVKAESFPTETALQAFLASKHWTLADELFFAEQELLSRKLLAAFGRHPHKAAVATQKWMAMTNCRSGYVVELCKQYKASRAPQATPSAAVQMEEINAMISAAHPRTNPLGAEDQLCKNGPGGKGYSCVAVASRRPGGSVGKR